jgi:uncharacterized protein DUF4112
LADGRSRLPNNLQQSASSGNVQPGGRQLEAASKYGGIERIAFLMDRAIRIPGTQIRFGLDPIIGFLFPEAGDVVGAAMSAYLILASVRHGLPKGVIARMVFNSVVDYIIGSVPLIGDVFDFAWKANDKNLELLKKHARGTRESFWSDWGWALLLLSLFGALVIGVAIVSIYSVRQVLQTMY